MISTSFSTTSYAASYINHQNQSKSFIRKELLARITSCALSALALLDTAIHTLGIIESIVYALFKAASTQKIPDFSNPLKHFRCVLIYLKTFPLITFSCICDPKHLERYERKVIDCINILFLSRDPKYSKDCSVDCLNMVKYLQKQTKKIDPKHIEGMEETLELLNDAKYFLSDQSFYSSKQFFNNTFKLTPHLSSIIRMGRQHQNWFIRECVTRLISLGLSLTCAIDILVMTMIDIPVIFIFILLDIPSKTSSLTPCFTDSLKYILSHIRDILIKHIGTILGSASGIIHPDTALKLVDSTSSFYKKIRFQDECPLKTPVEQLDKLENNRSLLVPISYQTSKSAHIVYCLISRNDDKYKMSILNKGYGTVYSSYNLALLSLAVNNQEYTEESMKKIIGRTASEKTITNTTYENLPKKAVKFHLKNLMKLQDESLSKLKAASKEKGINLGIHLTNKLNPPVLLAGGEKFLASYGKTDKDNLPSIENNPKLLMTRPQTIGDCPKSSLLAALYYHNMSNPEPYKRWKRHLKDQAMKSDGFLIGHSLRLHNLDRKALSIAQERIDKGWKKFKKQFPAANS